MKRGLGLVLGLLLVAIVVSAAATVVLFFLVTPSTRVADRSTLVLRPGGELLEVVPDDVLQFVSRSEARTVRGYVEALRKAKIDKRIAAVLCATALLLGSQSVSAEEGTGTVEGNGQDLVMFTITLRTSNRGLYRQTTDRL